MPIIQVIAWRTYMYIATAEYAGMHLTKENGIMTPLSILPLSTYLVPH